MAPFAALGVTGASVRIIPLLPAAAPASHASPSPAAAAPGRHRRRLDPGDRLISADGRPVAGQEDWSALLAAWAPGDSVQLVFRQRGREVRAVLRLRADPRLEVRPAELAGLPFTEAQRAFRTAWLGSRAGP